VTEGRGSDDGEGIPTPQEEVATDVTAIVVRDLKTRRIIAPPENAN
jgi:hypothetical protein